MSKRGNCGHCGAPIADGVAFDTHGSASPPNHRRADDCIASLRTRAEQAEAERDRYRSALRDVAREWPYLDLIDPQTAQERDLRGLVEYLLSALRSEQRVAREALEGPSDV